MTPAQSVPQKAFFKQHILPVLFIFLIPGFSAWFFAYAERRLDREIRVEMTSEVEADRTLSKEDKAAIIDFYQSLRLSEVMASKGQKTAEVRAMFEPVATRYAIFRWMKRIAWICLATIAATFVIVGLSVVFSLRSQAAQYTSLRIGWPVLRTSAAIQVLGQAVLAVALSFWVTAILTSSYYVKLIAIAGILAVLAVFALWKAIFSKVDNRCEVTGEMISESDAPGLWQRVRDMADKLSTAAPDRIIAGIEPNFFVTEHPVLLAGKVHEGRTLFLSLPMLKALAVDEADTVLGHELAHFSGQDTFWSRKIAPLTGKFALYINMLANGLSLVVAHFMLLFWKLYGLSIRRLSRAREFRADEIGASLVSKEAMKRALMKITCYCDYRARTESAVLDQQRVDPNLDLARQLERGYPSFLTAFAQSEEAINERVPHPFDTHPTLHNRLAQLGFDAREALRDSSIQRPVTDSWYDAIATAASLEGRLWADRQQLLQELHKADLPWRLLPKDEEEKAIVLEHFPRLVFRNKKGAEAILEFDRIQLAECNEPILFKDITSATVEDAWPKKRLTLMHRQAGKPKPVKTKCHPGAFASEKGDLLTMFGHYFSRHKTAGERSGAGSIS